jgi:predicted dehydrogenase
MPEQIEIAVAGLGRMGMVHALNAAALAKTGVCRLVALADTDPARLARAAEACGGSPLLFHSVEELADARVCRAAFVVTPTDHHRSHASALLRAGYRVLLEKPLTGVLESDREFAAELDRDHPSGVMIAFQRRFDPPLQYARELVTQGAIGRVFKIYSSLEDSGPPPDGYASGGILPDMSIHNVDEILWLTGQMPVAALSVGSNVYGHRVSTCEEDFDDAMLHMWFEGDLIAQVQVTRNHVSGYRVETVIYGEEGQIQIGRFAQRPEEVVVQTYGRRLSQQTPSQRTFAAEPDRRDVPEFLPRFRTAYMGELGAFIECCASGAEFPITHRDGLRAQTVISAAMSKVLTASNAAPIG